MTRASSRSSNRTDNLLIQGEDFEESNGDSTFTLPIPATYVIKTDGTVVYYFADADYTKRLEPAEVVKALREISGQPV